MGPTRPSSSLHTVKMNSLKGLVVSGLVVLKVSDLSNAHTELPLRSDLPCEEATQHDEAH